MLINLLNTSNLFKLILNFQLKLIFKMKQASWGFDIQIYREKF